MLNTKKHPNNILGFNQGSLKKMVMTIFILIATKSVYSQDKREYDFIFKFQPSALVAITRPTVQAAVEFKYKKTGIELSYGQQYGFPISADPDTMRVKNYGNRYRIDLKHYLRDLRNDSNSFQYFGISYCKIYSSQNITNDWFSGYRFDPGLAIIDNIHVFGINYGVLEFLNQFSYEFVLGTGLRYRTAESIDSKGLIIEKGNRIRPQLSISLKIGYRTNFIK